jgi:hypothetical protein
LNDVARLTFAIGAAAALLCAGVNTTAAQESPAGTPVTDCAGAGPGFIRLLDFSTCIRLGLDVTAAFADDVAQKDVHANTLRNSTVRPPSLMEPSHGPGTNISSADTPCCGRICRW